VTFVITEACIGTQDQACVSVCPVDCIHFEPGTDAMLFINPVDCIDCGACQPACPVDAIFPEGDVPAAQQKFIELNSLWYADAPAVRARLGSVEIATTVAKKEPAAAPAMDTSAAAPAVAGYIPPELRPRSDGFKWGENGVEGKCAVCGTYVIKGGVKFREKSVLCAEDAARQAKIANPYGANAGRR
jgi:ferredoxin